MVIVMVVRRAVRPRVIKMPQPNRGHRTTKKQTKTKMMMVLELSHLLAAETTKTVKRRLWCPIAPLLHGCLVRGPDMDRLAGARWGKRAGLSITAMLMRGIMKETVG